MQLGGQMKKATALFACVALSSCVSAVPQPQAGGASGGSFVRGWTQLTPVTDEYQVAWTVPSIEQQPRTVLVGRDRVVLRSPLLPERLFVADAPVWGRDGTLLAPAGTQFAIMDWPSLLVCSFRLPQTDGADRPNSICLLDEDRDGSPDTHFQGAKGSEWFVLSWRMPTDRQPLQRVELREVKPAELSRKPEFTIRIVNWPKGERGFRLRIDIDDRATFFNECARIAGVAAATCVAPPILIHQHSLGDGNSSVIIAGAGKSAKLRFQQSYGTLMGAEVMGFRVFFDEDEPAGTL